MRLHGHNNAMKILSLTVLIILLTGHVVSSQTIAAARENAKGLGVFKLSIKEKQ